MTLQIENVVANIHLEYCGRVVEYEVLGNDKDFGIVTN
jgi:hypothetical protein